MLFQEFTYTLPANGARVIDAGGNWARVREASGAIRLRLGDTGASCRPLPGQGIRGIPFNKLVLEDMSGSSNTVTIMVADEASFVDDRITGDVAVVDLIRPTCQLVGIAGGLALGGNVTQLSAPAANVLGLIVRSAFLEIQSGATGISGNSLVACPATPVSLNSQSQMIMLARCTSQQGALGSVSVGDLRRQIPPGWGLYGYTQNNGAAAQAAGYNVCFELLA